MNKLKNDQAKLNPCLKEHELTFKCFHDNDFNKEACVLHIENYKLCKEFWVSNTITVFTYVIDTIIRQ